MLKYRLVVDDDKQVDEDLLDDLKAHIHDNCDDPVVLPAGMDLIMEDDDEWSAQPIIAIVRRSDWLAEQKAIADEERREQAREAEQAPLRLKEIELKAWQERCRAVSSPIVVERRAGMGGAMFFVLGSLFGGACVIGWPALSENLGAVIEAVVNYVQ